MRAGLYRVGARTVEGAGLVVDRVAVGEAEVATAHVNGPDLKAVQAALEAGGYQLVRSMTKVG